MAQGRERATVLHPGMVVEERLSAGGDRFFAVDLKADQYLEIEIEEREVDVVARVVSPDDETLMAVDVRRGLGGLERLILVSEVSGRFYLRIRPFLEEAKGGIFRLEVRAWRPARLRDRLASSAWEAFVEAVELVERGDGEARRQAISRFKKSWHLWKEAEEPAEEAAVLNRIGLAYGGAGQMDEALLWYERALIRWRLAQDRVGEATTLQNMGAVYRRQGKVEKAIAAFKDALRLRRAAAARRDAAASLRALGDVYYQVGEVEQGLDWLGQALVLQIATRDRYGETLTRFHLGRIYSDLGQVEKAEDQLSLALTASRTLSYPQVTGRALNALAVAQVRSGKFQLALASYLEALALRRRLGRPDEIAATLLNLGRLYERLGDRLQAARRYEDALTLARQAQSPKIEARALHLLGWLAASRGETAVARDLLEDSLALGREIDDRIVEANALDCLGEVYRAMDQPQTAVEFLEQAIELRRESRNVQREATTLERLGAAHLALGAEMEAEEHLRRSLALHRTVGNPAGEAQALFHLATLARLRGDLPRARRTIELAIDVGESLRSRLLTSQLRASFIEGLSAYYELAIDLLMQNGPGKGGARRLVAAFELSERARSRSLVETLGETRAQVRRGIPPVLLAKQRGLEQQIRSLEWQRGASREGERPLLDSQLQDLLGAYENLEATIRDHSPTYKALSRPTSASLIDIQQELLDSATVLLHFSLGERRSFLWAVTKDELRGFELPGRRQIESLALEVQHLLTERNRPIAGETIEQRRHRLSKVDARFLERGAVLGEMLLGPVESLIDAHRLLVVADGALHYVPFAVLPIGNGARKEAWTPLVANHEVVNLPSASVAYTLRRAESRGRSADKKIALFADPVFQVNDVRVKSRRRGEREDARAPSPPAEFDDLVLRSARDAGINQFRRLRFSRLEVDSIAQLAPGTETLLAVDFNASRQAVINAELADYTYVHFATHTLLNDRHPQLSGIVLSLVDERGRAQDGFLRVQDILNLELAADLVVLSGCRTALGREVWGEGLMGPTRAFLLAGADGVLASLWRVDDRATSLLMELFYGGLLVDGLHPSAALRNAQIILWRRSVPAYEWAGFVLQGDWE